MKQLSRICSTFILLSLAVFAEQQTPGQTVQAVRIHEKISIDGILNESIWKNGHAVTEFFQQIPTEGARVSEEMEVRIAYDDEALYIGAFMKDTSPDSIMARLGRRDADLNADRFDFAVDCYHDKRSGYFFGLNAGGTLYDGIIYNDDMTDDSWDGIWEGRVRILENGWSAEMRIPFSQLRFKKKDRNVWGVNIRRVIQRRNEESFLVYTPRNSSGFASRFPDLIGIENIEPPRHIQALPYVRSKAAYLHPDAEDPFHGSSEYSQDAGLDLKIGLSNNLTLDMTLNPDFGQVEVDPAVVNLSDVESYFEERRPFFIEGAKIFQFGHGGNNQYWAWNWSTPELFYSRRIGGSPGGERPDNDYSKEPEGTHILAAGKITGKLGDHWNVGTIHALTRKEIGSYSYEGETFDTQIEPMSYYGVLRLQRELDEGRHGIGMISTLTARSLSDDRVRTDFNTSNFVTGVDGWIFLDTSRTWVVSGWSAITRASGSTDRITDLQSNSQRYYQRPDAGHVFVDSSATSLSGYAGRFYLNKQKGNVILNVAGGIISSGFEINDLGFLWRTDRLNGHVCSGYKWVKPGRFTRDAWLMASIWQTSDFDKNLLSRGIWQYGYFRFLNYYYLEYAMHKNADVVNTTRARGGPLTKQPGAESFSINWGTDNRKAVVFHGSYFSEWDDYKNRVKSMELEMTWNPATNVSLEIGPEMFWNSDRTQWIDSFDDRTAVHTFGKRYVFADLDQTQLSANVRVNWTFTPELSLQFYLQPLISHGKFTRFKELSRPGSYEFHEYSAENTELNEDVYFIDPDGGGPAGSISFDEPDFHVKSIRGNAVLRWEYRPGSTLYFVWTQQRSDDRFYEDFQFNQSMRRLWRADADNIFMLKATYWWNL